MLPYARGRIDGLLTTHARGDRPQLLEADDVVACATALHYVTAPSWLLRDPGRILGYPLVAACWWHSDPAERPFREGFLAEATLCAIMDVVGIVWRSEPDAEAAAAAAVTAGEAEEATAAAFDPAGALAARRRKRERRDAKLATATELPAAAAEPEPGAGAAGARRRAAAGSGSGGGRRNHAAYNKLWNKLHRRNERVAKLEADVKALEAKVAQLTIRQGRCISASEGMDIGLRCAMSNQNANSIGMGLKIELSSKACIRWSAFCMPRWCHMCETATRFSKMSATSARLRRLYVRMLSLATPPTQPCGNRPSCTT